MFFCLLCTALSEHNIFVNMNKHLITALSAGLISLTMAAEKQSGDIWSIGKSDGLATEFALAPDGYRDFLAKDFGYEDKYFLVGASDPSVDFPYVLPGPTDTWGGTWPTSGWRTHQVTILFDLDKKPAKSGYAFQLDLADYAKTFLPLVKISVNGQDQKFQLTAEGHDLNRQRKPRQNEPITDTLSITGNLNAATPLSLTMPLEGNTLRKGPNEITVTVLEGSWILFDHLALTGPKGSTATKPSGIFVRNVESADYQLDDTQPLIVDIEHLSGNPLLQVEVDGKKIFSKKTEAGRYMFEAPMPAVKKPKTSRYRILCDNREIASGTVVRSPQKQQTPADYIDTRFGTAHSRWMIAPGPWMPFSMVKLSPDNQNSGWQAGYQPSFENIGCFSHIHEWTLGGLGIMAANGDLKVKVGDEQKPDEGYRSRIDKRTEKAEIGYYATDLTDYGIKAEITATTRCGFERFTFPADRGTGRILIELHPEAEYGIQLKDLKVTQTGPSRIEGYCHQYSPGVWSHDADQDYNVNFVIEFDRPIKSIGSWCDKTIKHGVTQLESGPCTDAGLFVEFDPKENPVVQVRTAISPVSIANAAENLQKEVVEPFGWNFEAVRSNQVDTWNDLFARLNIKTDDRIEKTRFYNNMYRAHCAAAMSGAT